MTNELPIRAVTEQLLSKHAKKKKKLLDTEDASLSEDAPVQATEIISAENQTLLSPEEQLLEDKPSGFGPATPVFSPSLLGGLVGAVGLASGSSGGNTNGGATQIANQPQPTMADMMNMMFGMMLKGMPTEQMSAMMSQMLSQFKVQLEASNTPFDDMANVMGMMMSAMLNQVAMLQSSHTTQTTSVSPINSLAFVLGDLMQQLMLSITQQAATTLSNDTHTNWISSWTQQANDSSTQLMSDMSAEWLATIAPIVNSINVRLADATQALEHFSKTEVDALANKVQNFSTYLPIILSLADDIGSLADVIGNVSDRFLQNQATHSVNFLSVSTQVSALLDQLILNRDKIFFEFTQVQSNQSTLILNQQWDEMIASFQKLNDIHSLVDSYSYSSVFGLSGATNMADAMFAAMQAIFKGQVQVSTAQMLQVMQNLISQYSESASDDITTQLLTAMSQMMNALPVDDVLSLVTVLIDKFTEQMRHSADPLVDMAHSMGSMMSAFISGMMGNSSEQPLQDFAQSMGGMLNQFMQGFTGQADSAQAFGEMIGSLMGSMMRSMTGDASNPLQTMSNSLSEMTSRLMSDMSQNLINVMNPMLNVMDSMISSIDGNMMLISNLLSKANETSQSLIAQSPSYINTILSLSDDIGLMADRIGSMSDRIVQTQVIQSPNFLATQDKALSLINSLTLNQSDVMDTLIQQYGSELGNAKFDTIMSNLSKWRYLQSSESELLVPSLLYLQDESGVITQVSEASLTQPDGSVNVSEILSGKQLMIGFTVLSSAQMSLNDIIQKTQIIRNGNFDFSQLPVFSLSGSPTTLDQMSNLVQSMMTLFTGSSVGSFSALTPESKNAISAVMQDLMASNHMNTDLFSQLFSQLTHSMQTELNTFSISNLNNTMLSLMTTSLASMPIDSFNSMMTQFLSPFMSATRVTDNPVEMMSYSMGSMMIAFMEGVVGQTESVDSAQAFALKIGEMSRQFLVGVTGNDQVSTESLGKSMGSMMFSFMQKITGNNDNPLASFVQTMTDTMNRFVADFSHNASLIAEPLAQIANQALMTIQANMDTFNELFDQFNDSTQSMIELSPLYVQSILRLSQDIGIMADRIGAMADQIVATEGLQSQNFVITQQNALRLAQQLKTNNVLAGKLTLNDYQQLQSGFDQLDLALSKITGLTASEQSTIITPSDLYLLDSSGNIIQMKSSELLKLTDHGLSMSELIQGSSFLIGYTLPLSANASVKDLLNDTLLGTSKNLPG